MISQTFTRRDDRPHIVIDAPTAYERGAQRGAQLQQELPTALDWYLRFFRNAGVDDATARNSALRTAETLSAWRPAVVEEYEGIAGAAGLEFWHVAALNARTEVLAAAPSGIPGECSTVVFTPDASSSPLGAQTWDWSEELDDYWHTYSVAGTRRHYTGLTEQGILGKIGVNDAGLGILLNILGHQRDGVGGVPVHVLSATVLAESSSVSEAIDLLRDAPIASSTALTLLDRHGARTAELSPCGVAVIEPRIGFYAHTNHFLDTDAAVGEKGLYAPDTYDRADLLTSRFTDATIPRAPRDLARLLTSTEGEAHLCAIPALDDPFGQRWRTLATVSIDPATRTIDVLDGSPLERDTRAWRTLRA